MHHAPQDGEIYANDDIETSTKTVQVSRHVTD